MVKELKAITAASFIFFLAACGGGGSGNPNVTSAKTTTKVTLPDTVAEVPVDFTQAKAKWKDAAIRDYQFTYTRACNCPSEGAINVIVLNGVVSRAYYQDSGVDLDAERITLVPTLEKLFEIAEEGYSSNESEVRFTANAQYGYLAYLYVDQIKLAADDELIYTVTNFSH
jgi:hypothetical protein